MNNLFKFVLVSSVIFGITLKYYNSQLPSLNADEIFGFNNIFIIIQIITFVFLVFLYMKYTSIVLGKCFLNSPAVDEN